MGLSWWDYPVAGLLGHSLVAGTARSMNKELDTETFSEKQHLLVPALAQQIHKPKAEP